MEKFSFHIQNRLYTASTPQVMGIINITPDSFALACRDMSESSVLVAAEKALSDGADILDLGGQSTRSGAMMVGLEEEWRRVHLAASAIRRHFPNAILSVDTFRAELARRAVEEDGVDIINDISGGDMDADMYGVVARAHVPYICMHMRGTPETMQQLTRYDDIMAEITDYFARRVDRLHQMGVRDVILDPGFGFSKTVEQNYYLLRHLDMLSPFGLPVLAGLSRKSMLYKVLGGAPRDMLNATTAANMAALMGGAAILRVHDVRAAVETVQIYNQLMI